MIIALSWGLPLAAAGDSCVAPARRTRSDIGLGTCSTIPGRCTWTVPGTDGNSRTRTSRTRLRHLAPGEIGSV